MANKSPEALYVLLWVQVNHDKHSGENWGRDWHMVISVYRNSGRPDNRTILYFYTREEAEVAAAEIEDKDPSIRLGLVQGRSFDSVTYRDDKGLFQWKN